MAKNVQTDGVTDPAEYASSARSFLKASFPLDPMQNQESGALVPMMVCISFAAELALKALRRRNGDAVPFVHALKDHFEALPQDQADRIEKEVMDILPQLELDRVAVLAAIKTLGGGQPLPEGYEAAMSATTFRERLILSSNSFHEWRYHFQVGAFLIGEPNLLSQLAKAALRIEEELRAN